MNIYLILRFLLLFSSFNFTCCLNNVLFFASFHFKSIYIYIYIFIQNIDHVINQSIKKKKLSSIINQRNNFLKWKKIVTTRQRIRGIIPPHHSNFATSLTGDTRIVRVARYRYSSCNVSQSGGSVAKCSVFARGNGTSFQKNWDISLGDSRRGEKEIYFFFLNAFAKATEIDRIRRSSGIPELSQEDNSRGAMDEETELFLPLLWGPRPNGEEREKRRWLKMLDEVYIRCEEKVEEKFWPTMRKIFVRRWNISTLLVQYWNVVDERRGTCGTFVCEISRCVSVFRWNLKIEILFLLKKNGSVFGEKKRGGHRSLNTHCWILEKY